METRFEHVRRVCNSREDAEPTRDQPPIIDVLCGPTLCRLRVLTDQQWAELPASARTLNREHITGLGWVCAMFTEMMN